MGRQSVVILDNGSIFFCAVGRLLQREGWSISFLTVNPLRIVPTLAQVQSIGPELILVHFGLYARIYPSLAQTLLAEACAGPLLVVHNEDDLTSGGTLSRRTRDDKATIMCTTRELDAFLLGQLRGANAATSVPA